MIKLKRTLALLISLCMCISCFSVMCTTAFAEEEGENIALGKPVTASSKWDESGVPERLVDGVRNNYWARGSYTLAGKDETGGNDFAKIDLQGNYVINQVSIYTRSNDVVKDVRIDFSNQENFAEFKSVKVTNGDSTTLVQGGATNVAVKLKDAYRYVRVVSTISQFFILAEVEVYGEEKVASTGLEKYSDVTGTEYEGAVNLMQYLNLADAANEDEYGVYQYVTRAQVVDSIVRAFSETQIPGYGEELPFNDVDEGHPLYNQIFTAYKLGYVQGGGDGTFEPDSYVTGTELSVMLLRALGYGVRLQAESNPMQVATRIARKLDIYGGSEYMKKGDFVNVFYNALIAPTYDVKSIDEDGVNYVDGDNILYGRYKLELYEGIVFENNITSLKKSSKTKDNTAVVGDMEFTDADGVLNDYIGRSVVIGVSADNKKVPLFAWSGEKNSETVIKAEELERNLSDIESGKITTVNDNDKKTSYSVSNEAYYVMNGVSYPDCTAADVLIDNGTITLVDNNDDNAYEVVVIESYVMYTVESSSVSDDTLYLRCSGSTEEKKFEIDTDILSVFTVEGKSKAAKNVTRGSVIAMYASPYSNYYKIVIFSNVISGMLSEYDGNCIYIDGEAYKKASGFSVPAEIKLGDTVDIYINSDGKVIFMKKPTGNASAWKTGFCANWTNGGGFADDLRFKMFTEDGVFGIYYAADNVNLDGKRVSVEELNNMMTKGLDVLDSGERYIFQNFWKYKLNGNDEIIEMDTLKYDSTVESSDSFKYGGSLPEYSRYTSGGGAFYLYNEFLFAADNNTKSFTIPTVNGKYTTSDSYDKNYSVGNITSIVADRESAIQETVNYYMPDEYGVPEFLAKCKDFAAGGYGVCKSDKAPYMFVTNVGNTVDEDGMECVSITGIDLSTNREVSFAIETDNKVLELGNAYQDGKSWFGYGNAVEMDKVLADADYENYFSSVKTIAKGDMLRYENVDDDEYTVERAFRYDSSAKPNMQKPSWFDSTGGYTGYQFCTNRFQFARVADLNSVVLDLEVKYNTSDDAGTVTTTTASEKYFASMVKSINVYIVHDRGIEKARGDSLYAYTGDEYRIMLYTSVGAPSNAILYTYK